jgi:hypothetical protein
MHNAMITYWSKFQNRPQWSMWVLYAAGHDRGRSLGGIMFDDIGAQHRQGTAIFTKSFIKDAPNGDPDPAAWQTRMQFWTAVHEMGHAFNLAHSWQKALGTPYAPGDPWIPLANDTEARSFMNYPFRVAGGEDAFFSDFRFRFTDEELLFLRHAPRRFVQMGNSDWFVNHGFEAPDALEQTGRWSLALRTNRSSASYRFMEPVSVELKLTNTSGENQPMDADMLEDGRHVTVFLQRQDGPAKRWQPMITYCHETHDGTLEAGESVYGAHVISTATNGWLIDEPGFYKVQAAVDVGDEIVVSNVLRVYVAPPMSDGEVSLAPDYFTEEVGRVLTLQGSPALSGAHDVLQEVTERCAGHPAARHAVVAQTSPMLRNFKELDADAGELGFRTREAQVEKAMSAQRSVLLDDPDAAADTLGHIPYFNQLRAVAEATEADGNESEAIDLMTATLDVMKKREILPSVIDNTERRLKRRLQK